MKMKMVIEAEELEFIDQMFFHTANSNYKQESKQEYETLTVFLEKFQLNNKPHVRGRRSGQCSVLLHSFDIR